jgi:hypothetical protein
MQVSDVLVLTVRCKPTGSIKINNAERANMNTESLNMKYAHKT